MHMKKLIVGFLCMILLMLPVGIITAQGIVGESDLFTFDTRPIPVPLSNLAFIIAGLLIVAFLFVRYRSQQKRAHV
jgi:uncharacterized integral membrane protein